MDRKRGARLDRRKILFADDDPEIREVVRILLESEGYQVMEAENGEQAASMADDTFDLIILDVMMPGRILSLRRDTEKVKYPHPVPHGPYPGFGQDHGIRGRR